MSSVRVPAESDPTPYLLLGESMRRELTRRLRECIERWRREWADERSPEFQLELHDARMQGAPGDWRGAECFHAGVEVASATFDQRTSLLMLVVPSRLTPWVVGMRLDDGMHSQGSQSSATIATKLEMESLSMLASRILDAAGMQPAVLERGTMFAAAAAHEFIGARYLHVSMWRSERATALGLLISPALASGLLPSRRPATSQERMERRSMAVTPQEVGLEAVLGSAEISVAELARLAVGDVIVMNASLSDPGELRIRAGERIAAVSAGSCGGWRAVQIQTENHRGKS